MSRLRCRLEAVLRIFCQQAVQQRLQIGLGLRQLRQRRLAVQVDDGHRILGHEGFMTGEHFKQDDPQAVQITAPVDGLAMPLLRAHVVRRADDLAGIGYVGLEGCILGQAKIDEGHAAVFCAA